MKYVLGVFYFFKYMSFLRPLKTNTFQFGNLAHCPNCLNKIRKKYKKQVIKSKSPSSSFLYFGVVFNPGYSRLILDAGTQR